VARASFKKVRHRDIHALAGCEADDRLAIYRRLRDPGQIVPADLGEQGDERVRDVVHPAPVAEVLILGLE